MKSKAYFLLLNIFWCLPTLIIMLFVTWNMDSFQGFWISMIAYSIDVRASCAVDCLRDQISVLEAEQKKLKFKLKELEK